eukprot:3372626-Rhodomonas_salina.1
MANPPASAKVWNPSLTSATEFMEDPRIISLQRTGPVQPNTTRFPSFKQRSLAAIEVRSEIIMGMGEIPATVHQHDDTHDGDTLIDGEAAHDENDDKSTLGEDSSSTRKYPRSPSNHPVSCYFSGGCRAIARDEVRDFVIRAVAKEGDLRETLLMTSSNSPICNFLLKQLCFH